MKSNEREREREREREKERERERERDSNLIRLIDVSLTGVPTCFTKFYNFRTATLLAINIMII